MRGQPGVEKVRKSKWLLSPPYYSSFLKPRYEFVLSHHTRRLILKIVDQFFGHPYPAMTTKSTKMRVLIVDDSEDTAVIMSKYFHCTGHETRHAAEWQRRAPARN